MSADIINQRACLPIWVVHGVNWHCEVTLNETDADFDRETQAIEAASKAIWAFKGNDNGFYIVMDTQDEDVPFLGPTMIVHLKGTDPTKGFFPHTHVILANQGFYNDSRQMEIVLQEELKENKSPENPTESK